MAQIYEYCERHEPGSGIWEAHLTDDHLTVREALEMVAAMNECVPGLVKQYDGTTTIYRCKYDNSPVFAVKY